MKKLSTLILGLFVITVSHATSPQTDRENHATVYVIRPAFSGHAFRSSIDLNDKYLGSTYGGTYIKTKIPAGDYRFTGEMQNRAHLNMKLEPGKVYYLRQKVLFGLIAPKNKLVVIDEERARKLLKKCKASKEQSLETDYAQY